jgi:peptidoglycan-N-acetylglucosamine deacetylase
LPAFSSEGVSLPEWPNGCRLAVSMTFDVDAEAALLGLGVSEATGSSALSERRFGVVRGLGRILGLLADRHVKATFYVPGYTAETYPEAVSAITEGGHDIGHHGYLHRPPNTIDAGLQREELERGIEALGGVAKQRIEGYRSPSWEMALETFQMLSEMGFLYDSSYMGDDRPYFQGTAGVKMLELPVHWSLDDWPYYSWGSNGTGLLSDPAVVLAVWLAEFREAALEGGHVTYTAHPEVSGRRSRFEAFKALLDTMQSSEEVWFATHRQLAYRVLGRTPPIAQRQAP